MQVYLVGGAVRDELLGRPITERDWVIVGATPEDLIALGYTQVGNDFPVFLHPKTKEEYALARTERKQGSGYTGFRCDASRSVTLEQDLLRRDLTVNAMAKDTDGRLIDPYNGQTDLKRRLLRHVSPAFIEDPLRVLRVARFAARYDHLGFNVAAETMVLMRSISQSDELSSLTPERIWKETEKALNERSPHQYFYVLYDCQALAKCLGDVFNLLDQQTLSQPMQAIARIKYTPDEMPTAYAQCALICYLLLEKGAPNPISWLQRMRAPKVVITLSNMVLSIAKVLTQYKLLSQPIEAKVIVILFNKCDVWRKEKIFLQALEILDSTQLINKLTQEKQPFILFKAMLNLAKTVTAKDVISDNISGPMIKQALDAKREQVISTALTEDCSD